MKNPEIYIDGLNTFLRHFTANPSVSLQNFNCGGIVGLLKNIEKLVEMFGPSKVILVWEGGGSLRRRAIDPNYKDRRRPVLLNRNNNYIPDTVENRDFQIATIIEIISHTPVKQIYVSDCEADDVISYLCFKNKDKDKIIVSSDKDYYQLITPKTVVWSPNQKKVIDEDAIKEKFGILPENFCVARTLVGDQADGFKGAKGVGFATIRKLFPELLECNNVSLHDIIKKSNDLIENGCKSKSLKNIVSSKNDLEKIYKLSILETGLLSANQIKSIQFQENTEKTLDKFAVIKILHKYGLNVFDPNKFFTILKTSLEF